jgi:hypothetical protein
MTKEEIVDAGRSLPIEDMAFVRRAFSDMIHTESARLYRERMAALCKHPHVVDERFGQLEDQVRKVCVTCRAIVG